MEVSRDKARMGELYPGLNRHRVKVSVVAQPCLGLLVFFATMLAGKPAISANYPLELVMPREAGTAPVSEYHTISSGHRIFKAYPGIPYNIRAVVIGGEYPYTFSMSNEPSGMTINPGTGEINWPNPTGDSATPTIMVRDSENVMRSESWTITVTSNGFLFVDRVNGSPTGSGTIDDPWQDLLQVHNATNAGGMFLYLRSGTYTNTGIPRTGANGWERITFSGGRHPMVWLEYPGEDARYNAGYIEGVDTGAFFRHESISQHPIWVDGLEIYNFLNIGMQQVPGFSDYDVYRRLSIHHMIHGIDGQNPAGIMFTSSYTDVGQYTAVQNCEFYDLYEGGGLKIYSNEKMLIEDNVFRDSTDGFDLKTHVPRFEVRGNTFRNISNRGLYGNMHFGGGGLGDYATGEWRFNNINAPSANVAADVNQDGEARVVYVYRNTMNGRVRVRNVTSEDGPFHYYHNVIVNDDPGTPSGSHVYFSNVSDPSRVIIQDNLTGYPADGIIDTNGNLTSGYTQYIGTHGHQLNGSSSAIPSAPRDLRIQQ